MGKIDKISVLLLVILLSSLTTYESGIAETSNEADNQYAITDNNAIIMLSENASNTTAIFYPAHNSTDGLYVQPFWEFTNFSTGNGTVNLAVSANNCNITITSFNYFTREVSEQYTIYTDSWLNYTVEGRGNQTVDYTYLYSSFSPTRNPDVYIDGAAKEQGDGWSGANFGITITGASSRVSIHQASVDYFPPRNPPHLEPIDYLLPVSIVLAVVIVIVLSVLIFRRHQKTARAQAFF